MAAKRIGVLVVWALLLLPQGGEALMWELVPGTWRLKEKGRTVTFRVHKDRRFTLAFGSKKGSRRKLTFNGSYKVTVVKHNHKSATFRVSTIGSLVTIGGKPARRTLTAADALGTTIRTGKNLRFTLVTGCSGKQDWLQLCLHENRKGKTPHVACKTLHQPRRTTCPPPIDGSKLSRPPDFAR